MDYIITKSPDFFKKIGDYNYCGLEDMVLPKGLAIDTETTGLACRNLGGNKFSGADVFCVQIGTGTDNYIVDMQKHNDGYTMSDLIPYLQDKILVFHNAIFDLRFFFKEGFFPRDVHDTMVMSRMVYNGERYGVRTHNFGDVMARELGIRYDKSEQKNIAKVQLRTKSAIQYSFNDVDKLLELGRVLLGKIRQEGMEVSYDTQRNGLPALAYMEMCGLPLDRERWDAKIRSNEAAMVEVERKIEDYLIGKFPKYGRVTPMVFGGGSRITLNLNSQKQMIPVFKELGIDVINSGGKESLKEDVISKTKHEFVDMWLERQGLQKALSTFGETVYSNYESGRLYTSFNPLVDTSRISCRSGNVNFLNFPSDSATRKSFKASNGYDMVGADYSNQEVYCGADFHEDPVTLASIIDGIDLHCAFARVLYPELEGLSDAEIKENYSDNRQNAKAPRFTFQYGGNASTIHKNSNIPYDEAVNIEKAFKELHEGIYKWGDEMLSKALRTGYVESRGGFKIWLKHFNFFQESQDWIDSMSPDFWDSYRRGKKLYKKSFEEAEARGIGRQYVLDEYFLENVALKSDYRKYTDNKDRISKHFSRKNEYFKICLNNPAQSTSAHQTKSALTVLFNYIVDNGHVWDARIANSPYDEILMETKHHLSEEYKEVIERCMIEEGNKWLTKNLFSMKAEAVIGESWGDCH